MRLEEFAPHLAGVHLENAEVVGTARDGDRILMVYFDAEQGTVFNDGVTLQQFIDTKEGWHMTPIEAGRVGIFDYAAYEARRVACLEAEQDARQAAAPAMAR